MTVYGVYKDVALLDMYTTCDKAYRRISRETFLDENDVKSLNNFGETFRLGNTNYRIKEIYVL